MRPSISFAGTTRSSLQSPCASSGMNSMKRTPTPFSRPNAARSTISSSFTPRITTQLIFTGSSPASSAASTPARTRWSSSRRVSSANTSGRNESRDTLMRRSPASARSCAISGSFTPLLVIAMSMPSGASMATSRGRWARERGLAAGDADRLEPVALHADPHDPGLLLVGEQLLTGKPLHPLLGHAVRAPEVAAIGDRDPQVGDPAPERVDQGLGRRVHAAERMRRPAQFLRGHLRSNTLCG